jgi:hypothetical protein
MLKNLLQKGEQFFDRRKLAQSGHAAACSRRLRFNRPEN